MRRPLLMMRTRGLTGPFFGKHVGNRASHPLAHSVGNAISAGAVETLGPELIVNGSFADGEAGWALGVGWTISDGQAHCDGTQVANTNLTQNMSGLLIAGRTYQVSYDVTAMANTAVKSQMTGGVTKSGVQALDVGHFTDFFVADIGDIAVRLQGNVNFSGSCDNVSVREVIPGV